MRIIICVALEKELPDLIKNDYPELWCRIDHLTSGGSVNFSKYSFAFVVVGVGVKSKTSIDWILKHLNPTEIINIGTAGGRFLNTWYLCESVSMQNISSKIIEASLCCSLPIHYHEFSSSTCTTVNSMPQFDYTVVDMESYYIVEACKQANVPCIVIKYITDFAKDKDYNLFNKNLIEFKKEFEFLLKPLFSVCYDSVSVIIPTYNRNEKLLSALETVRSQSFLPSEVFIIDDGSLEPLNLTLNSDCEYLITHPENRGVSMARNIGIKNSKSDWIAFLDSDDRWSENHLFELMTYLTANPLLRWAQTDEKWIRNGKNFNKKKYHQKPDGWAFYDSLSRCLVSPSAVIIHKSMFEKFGIFNPNLLVCEDYDLWLRFLRYSPVGFIDKVTMTKFGGHADQLSTSFSAMDKFRLFSLLNLYNSESHLLFRELISEKILEKLKVLIQGASKRGLTNDLENYRKIKHEIINQNHLINVELLKFILN